MTNPNNITIHELIIYLDNITIREETKTLTMPVGSKGFEKQQQQKKKQCAQLLLCLAKQAAAIKEPNTLLSLLHDLPE